MATAKGLVICLVDIYDWDRGGHFRTYFRVYSRLLLECGHQVVALCGKPEEMRGWVKENVAAEYAVNFSAYRSHKPRRLRWLPRSWSLPISAWSRWRALSRDIDGVVRERKREMDGVFLMYWEDFTPAKGWFPAWVLEWIFHRPWVFLSIGSPESPRDGTAKTGWRFRAGTARNCKGWCVLDEKIQDALRGLFPKASVHRLPDVTDESPPDRHFSLAQEVLKAAKGRAIVSLLGLLERRKGLLTLMRVARQRPDVFFLFAGPYRDGAFSEEEKRELKEFIAAVPENCLFHAARLNEESKFNGLVSLSDIVFAAYVNFEGGSNVMTKAAIFRKPVIVSVGGLCEERLKRYRLGVAITEESDGQCFAAIDHLLGEAGRAEARDYEGFARVMSLEALREELNRVLGAFRG